MSFGSFEPNNNQPMSEINTTPLVDVMLVLLIIFMITAPLMTQSIQVQLPSHASNNKQEDIQTLSLQIKSNGELIWNDKPINKSTLQKHLQKASTETPQPQIQVLADKTAPYEYVAEVMAMAQEQGIQQLSFVMLSN